METAAELSNLGWRVTFVASGIPVDEMADTIGMVILPKPRLYFVGYFVFHVMFWIWFFARCKTADVIFFHQYSAPFLLPFVPLRNLLRRNSPKLVMDSRDLPLQTATIRGKVWTRFFDLAYKLASRFADGQTAITTHMAEAVGIRPAQLLGIWPSGVKPEHFICAAARRRWPGPLDPIRFVYIGALYEERNLLTLCTAVDMVRSEGLAVVLTLVGEGPLSGVLENMCVQQRKRGIIVRRAVPRSDVPTILAEADVGVLPFPDILHWRIASVVKMFEYMASGMPILATRIVAHTDVLCDEYVFWAEGGDAYSLAQAIKAVCYSRPQLSAMGSKALAHSKLWTWNQSARKLACALCRL